MGAGGPGLDSWIPFLMEAGGWFDGSECLEVGPALPHPSYVGFC